MLDPVATGQTRGVQAQARSCIQSRSSSSDSGQQQQQQCFTEQQRLCPYPDMRLCLTAQKLQLLNCCIEQRLGKLLDSSSSSNTDATAGTADTADTADTSTDVDDTTAAVGDTTAAAATDGDTTADASDGAGIAVTDAAQAVAEEADDDDEFFDSRDATSALPSPAQSPRYAHHLTSSTSSNTVGSAIVEPLLPQLCPLTSDMLPEHTAAAPRLLAAVAAADAAAFKSANPAAKQKDFVNWYSSSTSSNSSSRQQLQAVARTAAAEVWNKGSKRAQQHRALFDVAQEAEKALHHLVSDSVTVTLIYSPYFVFA
jgi:hypothetical protein